jgi:hypothetical protein
MGMNDLKDSKLTAWSQAMSLVALSLAPSVRALHADFRSFTLVAAAAPDPVRGAAVGAVL